MRIVRRENRGRKCYARGALARAHVVAISDLVPHAKGAHRLVRPLLIGLGKWGLFPADLVKDFLRLGNILGHGRQIYIVGLERPKLGDAFAERHTGDGGEFVISS